DRQLRAGDDDQETDRHQDEDRRQVYPAQKIGQSHKWQAGAEDQDVDRRRRRQFARDDAPRLDGRDVEQIDLRVRTLGNQPDRRIERHEEHSRAEDYSEQDDENLPAGVETRRRLAAEQKIESERDQLNAEQDHERRRDKAALGRLSQLFDHDRIDG